MYLKLTEDKVNNYRGCGLIYVVGAAYLKS